jgi:hypothetical protein
MGILYYVFIQKKYKRKELKTFIYDSILQQIKQKPNFHGKMKNNLKKA